MATDPTDCGTAPNPLDNETLTGAALKALVDANPSDYELVNRGPCGCCNTLCGIRPSTLTATLLSSGCHELSDLIFGSSSPGAAITLADYPLFPLDPGGDGCRHWIGPAVPDGDGTYSFIPCRFKFSVRCCSDETGSWFAVDDGPCSLSDTTRYPFVTVCPGEFCADMTITASPCISVDKIGPCGTQSVSCTSGSLVIRVCDTAPPLPNPCGGWWRIETGAYPYCGCVQGVTQAVGGPFATESACLATCGTVEWCAEYQDHASDHTPHGAPYKGCVSGDHHVGDVLHPDSGGSADHRIRTIIDGPFLAGCDCGPCTPPAKDESDPGCGAVSPPPPPAAPMGGQQFPVTQLAARIDALAKAFAKAHPVRKPLQMIRSDLSSLKPGTLLGGIPVVPACAHEGAILEACTTCGDKEGFNVRTCSVHGRCTRRRSAKVSGPQPCEHCPDYSGDFNEDGVTGPGGCEPPVEFPPSP